MESPATRRIAVKKALIVAIVAGFILAPAWADGQFRVAGHTATPLDALPDPAPYAWQELVVPTDETISGWYWEVIFNHLGLGMHYAVQFNEAFVSETGASEWYMDWKGDFFLSYHILGGGAVLDPFVEFGWANVGTAQVSSPEYVEYPDWEDELESGNAVALGFYNYFGAGLALDLNGLLLGAKLSYIPAELVAPIPDPTVERYDLAPFEVSFFGGIALGGHRKWRDKDDRRQRPHWDDWDDWD